MTDTLINRMDYKTLSDDYADAWDSVLSSNDYLFSSVRSIVDLHDIYPEVDLLNTFWQSYLLSTSYIETPSSLIIAIRALNIHVLVRGEYATLNAYYAANQNIIDPAFPTPTDFVGGNKVVTFASVPEELTSSSDLCEYVWIGAPVSATGDVLNTKTVFVGDSTTQSIPILTTNHKKGIVIPINDASQIYIKVGANGESVNYRIFSNFHDLYPLTAKPTWQYLSEEAGYDISDTYVEI